MAVLINGNGYSPVTAQQDADLYAGIIGQALTVLNVGEMMAATIIDNNTVRIGDGEAVCQGRRIHNDAGEYDDFTIPSGSQGITSYYIIGYRLYDDDGDELCATFVEKMDNATDTIAEAVLRDGAAETYISFYRVTVTGLSITSVDALYNTPTSGRGLIDAVYPVGSIYMSVNNTNPATFFGGTWVAWGSGRVPVGVDTSQTEFDTVEETGGAKTHTLLTTEIPSHRHEFSYYSSGATGGLPSGTGYHHDAANSLGPTYTGYTGGGAAHNNLQPYITCYMFKRTA